MSQILILYGFNQYYNRIIKEPADLPSELTTAAAGHLDDNLYPNFDKYRKYKFLFTNLWYNGATQTMIDVVKYENYQKQCEGLELTDANFNPGDGVYTKHVLNIQNGSELTFDEPDYLVVYSTISGYMNGKVPANKASLTRWFVLESNKIRGNQIELSLRRDLLTDYYEDVCASPTFIERGFVSNINDPAIFNKESFTFNQIKREEILLKDKIPSNKGWVVGYLSRATEDMVDINATTNITLPTNILGAYSTLPADLRAAIEHGEGYYTAHNDFDLDFEVAKQYRGYTIACYIYKYYEEYYNNQRPSTFNYVGKVDSQYQYQRGILYLPMQNQPSVGDVHVALFNGLTHRMSGMGIELRALYDATFNQANPPLYRFDEDPMQYNGRVYTRDGKYYKLTVTPKTVPGRQSNVNLVPFTYTKAQVTSSYNALCSDFNSYLNHIVSNHSTILINSDLAANSNAVTFYKRETYFEFTEEEVIGGDIEVSIKHASRRQLFDAPYDMFCIPSDSFVIKKTGETDFTSLEDIAVPMGRGIKVAGGSAVYDIQVLPYCPMPEVLGSTIGGKYIDLTGLTEHTDFDYITTDILGQDAKIGVILYPKRCKFNFSIKINTGGNEEYFSNDSLLPEDFSVLTKKVRSETEVVRIVSPNFASSFEFNLMKNYGLYQVDVYCFYKPYMPYILCSPNPIFGNSYYHEAEFADPFGLICSGDFSISAASNQWEEYQIQNKNYELIFNRQIENLDVNNSIAMSQAEKASQIGVATSAVAGVGAGALVGSQVGGGIGAAVGSVVGGVAAGVASGVGRKYDLEYLRQSQAEARSFALDMYAYSLGNIKARPNTLTKVSSLTSNFKVFPFIEIFDCTDVEKVALTDKIKYNGMTIMRIGKIEDFRGGENHFVQGQLIRFIHEYNDLADSHVVAEIAKEIKEGAYFYGLDTE